MGSPVLVKRTSLWATVALYLWGVQVIGLAASRQGICGVKEKLEEEFWWDNI